MIPEPQSIAYYEWDDIRTFLCEQLGVDERRFRDYANKYGDGHDPAAEYQDFWHVWLWIVDDKLFNDSYMPFHLFDPRDDAPDSYFRNQMKERFGEWAWDIIPALHALTEQLDLLDGTEWILIHYEW